MKKGVIAVLAAVLIAAAGYYFYTSRSAKDGSGYVTAPVKRGDITSSVSATGKLKARVSVIVGTEVSGTIRDLNVDYNSAVKKGEVLIKLDQQLFIAQVDQAKAKVAAAEADLKQLEDTRDMNRSEVKTTIDQTEAEARKASADAQRNKMLFDKGVIARADLDTALKDEAVALAQYNQALAGKGKYASIDAQIASSKAALEQARAALSTAQTNLSKSVIRAPMDGVVIEKNVEVGQTVAASFSTPTLLNIGDLSEMEVDISIDEADVGSTAVGQDVEFTVDAFPGRVFTGKLSEIQYAPIEVQNVVTYNGVLYVKNPEGLLRPGMTANVNIITSRKKDVLMVPSAALRIKMGGQAGKIPRGMRTVWVLENDKPKPVFVKTGATDFVNTEIVSGLKEGEQVIVEAPYSDNGSSGRSPRHGMMRF